MSREEFVYWLRAVLCEVMRAWQIAVIAVVAATLLVAPVALIQWLCSMVAGV